MKEKKGEVINVFIESLYFPIQVGLRSSYRGETTLAKIDVKAEIEKVHEDLFEEDILSIINARGTYTGARQLFDKLVDYLNSIFAKTFSIRLGYFLFLQRKSVSSDKNNLVKYYCEQTVMKTSLIDYSRIFKIEIPIVMEQYVIPGIQREMLDIPIKLIVKLKGNDTIFAEDILDIIDEILRNGYYYMNHFFKDDLKLLFLDKLNQKLSGNIENCTVKIVTQKVSYTYSTEVSLTSPAVQDIKKYQALDIFN